MSKDFVFINGKGYITVQKKAKINFTYFNPRCVIHAQTKEDLLNDYYINRKDKEKDYYIETVCLWAEQQLNVDKFICLQYPKKNMIKIYKCKNIKKNNYLSRFEYKYDLPEYDFSFIILPFGDHLNAYPLGENEVQCIFEQDIVDKLWAFLQSDTIYIDLKQKYIIMNNKKYYAEDVNGIYNILESAYKGNSKDSYRPSSYTTKKILDPIIFNTESNMQKQNSIIPLIPYELFDEYKDFLNPQLREVVRANCLRRFIEGMITLFFEPIFKNLNKNVELNKAKNTLHKKIELIGKCYDKEIMNDLLAIKNIGNDGSHFGNVVSKEDIVKGINIAINIVEKILIKYFIQHPVGTQLPVLSYMSLLPPTCRVRIWEKVWSNGEQNSMLIDKLSLAYVKDKQYEKALCFLREAYDNKKIKREEFDYFINKINIIQMKFDEAEKMFSKTLLDTNKKFKELSSPEIFDEYKEFMNIFMTLISAYHNCDNNDFINNDNSLNQ